MCACVSICSCECVHGVCLVCVCACVCACACVCVHFCMCACVSVVVCLCACARACLYVCICVVIHYICFIERTSFPLGPPSSREVLLSATDCPESGQWKHQLLLLSVKSPRAGGNSCSFRSPGLVVGLVALALSLG